MAARGTIRTAVAFAALFAALTSVGWRQSRALEVMRELDAVRQDRALSEAERERIVHVAQRLEYVGVLGVEFFVSDGHLLVNEIAPRPHNSGHYTIDACTTNQFEQQVRALTGLPLGDPRMHSYAAMVNILGDVWQNGDPAWEKILAHVELKLHLYGKHEARKGRKMGHFTVLGKDVETVAALAMQGRSELGIGD